MKTILVATDFSNGGSNAVKYARKIAKVQKSKILYIHVVNLPVADSFTSTSVITHSVENLKTEAETALQVLVDEDVANNIVSGYKCSFNDIYGLIEEVEKEEEVSLLVIGKTGQRGFIDRLIGSTAQNLINKVHLPLLVIPEAYEGNILDKVCYASKLEFDEETYIGHALEWSAISKTDLVISHIIEEFALDINANEQFIASINERFKWEGYSIKNCAADTYKEGITEFVEDEKVSLLIVTSQKRNLLESIIQPSKTKGIINSIQIPILIYNYEK